jgi:hypothetical protein
VVVAQESTRREDLDDGSQELCQPRLHFFIVSNDVAVHRVELLGLKQRTVRGPQDHMVFHPNAADALVPEARLDIAIERHGIETRLNCIDIYIVAE